MPTETELAELQAELTVCEAETVVLCVEADLANAAKEDNEAACAALEIEIADCLELIEGEESLSERDKTAMIVRSTQLIRCIDRRLRVMEVCRETLQRRLAGRRAILQELRGPDGS